ncbi:ABC transporter permease subunit [candidate division GN15 bacterium]|nr:ABC transporter permease subunit [candidate division GN15 bacterium]
MRGLAADTYRELVDRKLLWLYGIVTVIMLLSVFAVQSTVDNMRLADAPPEMQEQIGDALGQYVIGGLYWFLGILVFLTVMGTAGLIPSMFSRGRAEFYLSKPASRTSILLGKLAGIWSVYGGLMVLAGLLVLGTMVVAYDLFSATVFFVFVAALVDLFIWLSVTGFVGVLSGSFAMSIMAAFALWIIQWLLTFREAVEQLVDNSLVLRVVDTLYYMLPKFSQLGDLFLAMGQHKPVDDWLPLWSSLAFAVVLYIATVWLFKRKDY